jgi:tetratricopeptide (TPR) repeat protein
MNHKDLAVTYYIKAIKLDPGNYLAMENLARIYEKDPKHIPVALKLYKRALQLEKRDEWKDNLRIWIRMIESRFRPDTESAVGCWHLANEKSRTGDPAEAHELYSKAIELNPDMFQAFYSRGMLRQTKGDLQGALADYEAAATLAPRLRGVFVRQGLVHESLGKDDLAMAAVKQGLKNDPRDPEVWYYYGHLLEKKNQLADAYSSYLESLTLCPKGVIAGIVRERIAALSGSKPKMTKLKSSSGQNESHSLW